MSSTRDFPVNLALLVWMSLTLPYINACSFYDPLFSSEGRLTDSGDSGSDNIDSDLDGGDYAIVTDGDENPDDENRVWGDFDCGKSTTLISHGFDPPGPHGEIRISSAESIMQHDGDGNKVVYTDNRGNPYLIDLTEESEVRLDDLLTIGVHLGRTWIRDDVVIYNGRATNDAGEYVSAIVICDLQAKRGKILYGVPNDEGSGRWWASTGQRRVVWQDNRFFTQHNQDYTQNRNLEIYMYDMDSDTETRITNVRYQQSLPDIFGDYIVWLDLRDQKYEIYLYRISTGEERKISPDDDGDHSYPEIWGDSVIWVGAEDMYSPQGDIYHYSIENDELRKIGTGTMACCKHVGERYVVWSKRGHDTSESHRIDVFLYDLQTQEEKRVSWGPNGSVFGVAMGDKILWRSDGLFITLVDAL